MQYDLEERTAKFGENIILFCKSIPIDTVSQPLINQLVKSATSIGANYMEANQVSSKRDFKNKIRICLKEANETKHWLRMLSVARKDKKIECMDLWDEAHQFVLIFSKIVRNV